MIKQATFPIREECNVNDVISMTDNESTKTTFVRTRPALRGRARMLRGRGRKFWALGHALASRT